LTHTAPTLLPAFWQVYAMLVRWPPLRFAVHDIWLLAWRHTCGLWPLGLLAAQCALGVWSWHPLPAIAGSLVLSSLAALVQLAAAHSALGSTCPPWPWSVGWLGVSGALAVAFAYVVERSRRLDFLWYPPSSTD